ncbi:cyclin-dependent kinase 9 [Caerostris extrusa]|uniref:Cyclin-dependent kinase 9 n=1 Tax=Caerostris extrusa TaxID=172846 RepID=A0AAV4TKK0_CAEEX|nr:cyclin-dependent kinase 9 [Caerostris extrusa]
MPTPVPWPVALDYAVEDPCEQPNRGGPTDSRLGLNPHIYFRDLKPSNILITKSGIVKLADFGLARFFRDATEDQPNRYTNKVVTLWYRPPELLLGDRNYGPPVDMWAAGCVMAEMWTRFPIIEGNSNSSN